MDTTSTFGRLSDLVLTRDPAQRVRLSMCVTAAAAYLVYCALLVLQIYLGFANPLLAWSLVAAELTAALAFYAVIRSGINKRFVTDPSLTRAQLAAGSVFTLGAYAAVGPGSSAILMVVASQVVYTMFAVPPRQVNVAIAMTLVALGATMWTCHHLDPARYPGDVQLMAFLYACLVYPLIGSLATRLTSMSERLRTSKRDLQKALDKVSELATRDELTRIYNRRHMTDLMTTARDQHRRTNQPWCLGLMDIDFFKAVNDRFGHQAGDEVLRRFAQVAQEALRSSDLLCRWGGEEFMVLFQGTSAAEAMRAMQRVQDHLHAASFDDIAPGLRVSFSGGVTAVAPADELNAAIERADQAMYQAKTTGRCRSMVA